MDIYQLQVFSSVYRLRSFSRASEELHITQLTVSMHIKRLESELGVRLFDRTGRKTIPTIKKNFRQMPDCQKGGQKWLSCLLSRILQNRQK